MVGWGFGGFGEGGTNILEYEPNSLGPWPRVLWSSILEYLFVPFVQEGEFLRTCLVLAL